MEMLLAYNFDPVDVADGDFTTLYTQRRRDSAFACVYKTPDGNIYALRDHLGIVPLYYRRTAEGIRFALCMTDLVESGDKLDSGGLLAYLSFGTPRLAPVIAGIEIVPPGTVIRVEPSTERCDCVYQYKLQPSHILPQTRFPELVDRLNRLFTQAIQRVIRHERVGLYLSGGIDSALIGIYLRKAGVAVNAYTSAPWGRTSSEIPFAKTNADIMGVNTHVIDCLETDAYQPMMDAMPGMYGGPHGTTTALGVTSLWASTTIGDEKQVFFGQNSDTMMCALPEQYLTYFMQLLPSAIRRKAHRSLTHTTLEGNYLAFARGFEGDCESLNIPSAPASFSRIQRLLYLGMYAAHTPSDSEVLAQPAIIRNIAIGDPYHDIDLVEFALGLPFRHRFTFSRESCLHVALEKRLIQMLALRYLPDRVVYRKKGFVVSFERDRHTRQLAALLPNAISGILLQDINKRFAAQTLMHWSKLVGIELVDVLCASWSTAMDS
jgi:asparagine synthetase B (glutamine-hydrolysing)